MKESKNNLKLTRKLQKLTGAYADAAKNLVDFNSENEAFINLMNRNYKFPGNIGRSNAGNLKWVKSQVRKVYQIFLLLAPE